MTRLSDPSFSFLILGGQNVSQIVSLVATILALVMTIMARFTYVYIRARYEFPGPPVKNFWTGNLDQTMADNVHEKVSRDSCIRTDLTADSGCNGIVNMDTSFRPSVSSFNGFHHVLNGYQWNSLFSRVIYIGDPEMITTIANSNWPKSKTQYDGFRPLSGDALFVQTDHEKWRIQRKRLAPAFSPNIIEAQYDCFAKHLTVSDREGVTQRC